MDGLGHGLYIYLNILTDVRARSTNSCASKYMHTMKQVFVIAALSVLFLLGGARAADAEGEETLDLSGDGMTVPAEELNPELPDDWNPVTELGADLACSACEMLVDKLVAQQRYGETFAKNVAEKEAKEEAKKKDEEGKEDKAEEKKDDDAAAEDKDTEKKDSDDAEKKDEKKDGKKKGKKDKKDKNKKDKKDKKDKIVIDKTKVAETVLEAACNRTNFLGVTSIGSYPGRMYQNGNRDALATKTTTEVISACQDFLKQEGNKDFIVKQLSGNGKGKVKKLKKRICEKRAKVCKSAALGFEAESSCLMKAMRAFDQGDFDKAKKNAADCQTQVV